MELVTFTTNKINTIMNLLNFFPKIHFDSILLGI
jgi:hypothetical protein